MVEVESGVDNDKFLNSKDAERGLKKRRKLNPEVAIGEVIDI